jgi:hypothetical protein
MSTPSEIIKAWWIAASPSKEQSELAQKRLEICVGCDAREESLLFGYRCKDCGCPIGKKIFTAAKKACPRAKWNDVEDEPYLNSDKKENKTII